MLESHLTLQFHLIRIITGNVVNIHKIHSPDIFSHIMAQCALGVILNSLILQVNMFLETWELRAGGNNSIFLLWKVDSCSLKISRGGKKIPVVQFSPHYNYNFGQTFEFSERNGLFSTSLGSSSDSIVSLSRVTTGMAINSARTLSLHYFFHGVVQCVVGVYLHSSKSAGKHCFWILETVA